MLQTPDLDEFHQRMLAYGVPCIQNPTEVFGTRVAYHLRLRPVGRRLSKLLSQDSGPAEDAASEKWRGVWFTADHADWVDRSGSPPSCSEILYVV